jgi:hypothetical protein
VSQVKQIYIFLKNTSDAKVARKFNLWAQITAFERESFSIFKSWDTEDLYCKHAVER